LENEGTIEDQSFYVVSTPKGNFDQRQFDKKGTG
jgi:hypothetical protein